MAAKLHCSILKTYLISTITLQRPSTNYIFNSLTICIYLLNCTSNSNSCVKNRQTYSIWLAVGQANPGKTIFINGFFTMRLVTGNFNKGVSHSRFEIIVPVSFGPISDPLHLNPIFPVQNKGESQFL